MNKAAPVNALSFDVEEYYHALNFRAVVKARPEILSRSRVEIGTERILEILSRASVQATFFILGDVARAHPALVRRIVEAHGGHMSLDSTEGKGSTFRIHIPVTRR